MSVVPAEQAREARFAECLVPCGDEAAGRDPRHGEQFALLKCEIEKLDGNDYERVRQLACGILNSEGKDLRVCAYLALAALRQSGLDGFAEACRVYAGIVSRYREACHPRRAGARRAAVQWLNSPRFLLYLERAADRDDPARLEAANEALDALARGLRALLGEELEPAEKARSWIARRLSEVRAEQQEKAAAEEAERTAPPVLPLPAAMAAPASDADLVRSTRGIVHFLRDSGDWLGMVAYARALRWSSLEAPPHADGRTRVSPLRPGAVTEIEAARARGDWKAVFLACEAAFLEPGGQFYLPLQQFTVEASAKLGRVGLEQRLRHELGGLLHRHPSLPELRFDDDQPFAPPACAAWLLSIERAQHQPLPAVEVGGRDASWAAVRDDSVRVARDGDLNEAIKRVDVYPAKTGRTQALVLLHKARLCLDCGYPRIALPLLESLHRTLVEMNIGRWEPALLMDALFALRSAVKALGGTGSAGREESATRIADIERQMCALDVGSALSLLERAVGRAGAKP